MRVVELAQQTADWDLGMPVLARRIVAMFADQVVPYSQCSKIAVRVQELHFCSHTLMHTTISHTQALASLALLTNLPVSRAWRGFGSAIFLEFGPPDAEGAGAHTLTASEDWSLRSDTPPASADTHSEFRDIDTLLRSLEHLTVQDVSLTDDAVQVALGRAQVRIGLRGLHNTAWSLHPVEGAFLTTANGRLCERGRGVVGIRTVEVTSVIS